MDEQTSLTTVASASGEESFDIAVRGYSRPQVQQFVTRTTVRIRDLEEQLSATSTELEQARTAALQAHRELAEARASAGSKPAHEEISGRLSQILRLAAEEAEQERAKAEAEIGQARRAAQEQAQQLVASARQQAQQIVERAQAEADKAVASAREQSDYLLTTSRAESEELLRTSRAQSEELLRTSRAESDELLRTSRAESERLLTNADRRATAVNEESSTRLDALTETHGEVVRRLAQIRDVLGDLLAQDDEAGSLAAAVDAALGLTGESAVHVGARTPADRAVTTPTTGESPIVDAQFVADNHGIGLEEAQPAAAAQPAAVEGDTPQEAQVNGRTKADAESVPAGGR